MPDETKFIADGVGNGLPYCPEKVNVSDSGFGQPYDYWITLGGFKKGDAGPPTDQQVADSLVNAMKLLWNIDGYKGDDSKCTSTFDFGGGEKTAEVSFPVGSADATSGSLDEPKDRVCIDEPASEEYQVLDESTDDVVANVICGAPEIVRMYDGDETDEGNFVGYGITNGGYEYNGGITESTFAMEAGELYDVSVQLLSYMDGYSDEGPTDYAYTEMNGIHFVCETYNEYPGGATISDPLNRSIYVPLSNIVTSIKIDEFDFYTYPA